MDRSLQNIILRKTHFPFVQISPEQRVEKADVDSLLQCGVTLSFKSYCSCRCANLVCKMYRSYRELQGAQ